MPIYEFECRSCGTRFERLQKLADTDPTDCPHCTTPQVHRRLTAPAFRLAGSGWYETDFKSDGDKKRNLADSADTPKKEPTTEPKPETSTSTASVEKPASSTTTE